jgi:hypothetical protein
MVHPNIVFIAGQLLALKKSSFIPTAGIYYILSKKMPKLPKYWYPILSSVIITEMFQKVLSSSSNISEKYRKYINLFLGRKRTVINNYLGSKNRNNIDMCSYTHPLSSCFINLIELTSDVVDGLINPTMIYYLILFVYRKEKFHTNVLTKYILNFYRTLLSITMFSTFSFTISEGFSRVLSKKNHINFFPYFISMGVFLGTMIERKERWRSIMLFVLSQYLYTKIKFEEVDKHLLAGYVSYLMV